MDLLDLGLRDKFFEKWNICLPNLPIELSIEEIKLEFNLEVYFLIYEIHPINNRSEKIEKKKIEHFKKYLDSNGAKLSQVSEFLPFYALPYIPNPREHPVVKHFFSNEWVLALKEQLHSFLTTAMPTRAQPLIYTIYQAHISECTLPAETQ